MIARHYADAVSMSIFTDFDLLDPEEIMQAFVEQLQEVPGVETINLARYHVDVTFAFLFNSTLCSHAVLSVFENMFGVDASTEVSISDIADKIVRDAGTEANSTVSTLSDIFKSGRRVVS